MKEQIRRVLSRRWKTAALVAIVLFLSFGLYTPVKTVKGLLVDSGLTVANNIISVDGNLVAFESTSSTVTIYDIVSGSSTSFSTPGSAYQPIIDGDKVVINGNITGLLTPSTIYYCELPHTKPLQPCGPWEVAAQGQGLSFEAFWGFPVARGDLIVWPVSGGFSFWRFSTGTTTTITAASTAGWPSTNGELVAFEAKPASSPSYDIMYYDTSNPGQGIVNTGLPARQYATSLSQYTIAFNDNTTTPNRIRYYDILRNQASTASTGPLGNLTYYGFSGIWGDRIVFSASEKSLGFDCNGDGTQSSSEQCLQYWNIRAPGYIATTLAASAAPPTTGSTAIFDKTIIFQGTANHLQFVTVPMKGDVDQNGIVDANDQSIVKGCLGQLLKGTVC